jgi:hypothetical protein
VKLYAVEFDMQDSYNIEAIFRTKVEAQKVVNKFNENGFYSKFKYYGVREFELLETAEDYFKEFN